MLSRFYGVSPRAWRRVLMWTALGPLICAAICVVFVWFNFRDLPPGDLRRVIITAFILPLIIAAPLFFLHSLKLRELASPHRSGAVPLGRARPGVRRRRPRRLP